jgi:hypothetical protein
MEIKTPRARTILISLAFACLSFAVLVALYTLYVRHTASTMLRALTDLKAGTSSSSDAERYAQRFRRHLVSHDCKNSACTYEFEIRNTLLSSMRLEPSAGFGTRVTVEGGVITRIGAGLVRTMDIYPTFGGSAGMVQEYSEIPNPYPGAGHYVFPTPIGKPYLQVRLDSHATPEQRKHAFDFSFRCLTKLGGGCDLPCDYLPSAWKDWKVDLQTTGFPMNDFNQTYRNNDRCK